MLKLRKARPLNPEASTDFAKKTFAKWPNFKPTRALYLDFEGGGTGGDERILSLYWPQLPGRKRFHMLWRGHNTMNTTSLLTKLHMIRCEPDNLEHIVVFSGGELISDEQRRFEEFFGEHIFPGATWVNMHLTMRQSSKLRRSVRKDSWSKPTRNRRLIPNNLENLEHQFGYERPPEVRDHKNEYRDGLPGKMSPLDLEQQAFIHNSLTDFGTLIEYCEWDVQSMFRITQWCEIAAGKKVRRVKRRPARTISSTISTRNPNRVSRWSSRCVGKTLKGRQCRSKGLSSSATAGKAYCSLHRNQASPNSVARFLETSASELKNRPKG